MKENIRNTYKTIINFYYIIFYYDIFSNILLIYSNLMHFQSKIVRLFFFSKEALKSESVILFL